MATWSSIRGSLTITKPCTSDGANLYWRSTGTDIYQYNPATDTLTQISNAASWGGSSPFIGTQASANLCWFNGNLYAGLTNNDGSTTEYAQVWKWDGGGTSWTKVFEDSAAIGSSISVDVLASDDTYIVVGYSHSDGGLAGYGSHSTDGASWSSSTLPSSWVWFDAGYFYGNDNTLGIYAGGKQSADYKEAVFSAGTWSIAWDAGSGEGIRTPVIDRVWCQESGGWKHTTDFSTFTAPTDTTTQPIQSLNMPYSVGYRAGINMYLWDAGADEWNGTAETGVSGTPVHVIRLSSNNKVYVITTTDVFERSAALADPAPDALRLLRLDADTINLYATMIEGGTLKLKYYDLANLAAQGTSTFAAAAYTDPDDQTAGIFPVARPGSDQVLYLHGRDGNSVQVQYNDLNGTLGWQDIGPGTATWGTAKFCTALMPDVFAPLDVIAAFDDGDFYRSNDNTGTGSWVQMGTVQAGTVTVGLRQAGQRYTLEGNEAMLAGTAAGRVMYTPNYGVSWDNVGGTACGTVYGFAESY